LRTTDDSNANTNSPLIIIAPASLLPGLGLLLLLLLHPRRARQLPPGILCERGADKARKPLHSPLLAAIVAAAPVVLPPAATPAAPPARRLAPVEPAAAAAAAPAAPAAPVLLPLLRAAAPPRTCRGGRVGSRQ
jgi:hypothetical protein